MIEWFSFFFGLGFGLLVYFRSIRTANLPGYKKAFYFIITFIGIFGMVFLSGVLVGHFARKLGIVAR